MNAEQYVARVPDLYRNAFQKALAGKVSPRQAIKQKCLDCCCFQRKEVELCNVKTCPLFPFKPTYGSKPSGSAEAAKENVPGASLVGSTTD